MSSETRTGKGSAKKGNGKRTEVNFLGNIIQRKQSSEIPIISMENELLKEAGKLIIPHVPEFDYVDVEINTDNDVYRSYLDALYDSYEESVCLQGGTLSFSKDELDKYMNTLIAERIKRARGEKTSIFWADAISVPAFLSVVMANIGRCEVMDLGISIKPKWTGGATMSRDEALSFSRKLISMAKFGFVFSSGYTKEQEGDWGFMCMQLIDNWIKCHNADPHPTKALLASFVATRMTVDLLTPRVNYGSVTLFQSIVKNLALPRGQ